MPFDGPATVSVEIIVLNDVLTDVVNAEALGRPRANMKPGEVGKPIANPVVGAPEAGMIT